VLSCEQDTIRVYKIPKPKPTLVNTELEPEKSSFNLIWNKPESWQEVQGHSMRLASFKIPHEGGYADLSITSFPGKSGGIAANVNRWLGQIGLEPMDSLGINKIQKNRIGKLGNYKYFKLINNDKERSAILASIFELQGHTLFIKCSLPFNSLEQIESDFIPFCGTLFFKN
tara:strand:+ start:3841 stop:4353 length:513 start_codon:yes stop_codon:yes gene_type:complete